VTDSTLFAIAASQMMFHLDGSFAFVVVSVISLANVDGWLTSFWTTYYGGGHGAVFVILADGIVLGSSFNDPTIRGAQVTNHSDPYLSALAGALMDAGFLNLAETQPVSNQTLGIEAPPANVGKLMDVSIHIDGHSYHLQASPATSIGLTWITCVLTLDSDFNNGISGTIVTTAIASAAVLVAVLLLTLLLSHYCLILPVRKVASAMQTISLVVAEAEAQIEEDGRGAGKIRLADHGRQQKQHGGKSSAGGGADRASSNTGAARQQKYHLLLATIYEQWLTSIGRFRLTNDNSDQPNQASSANNTHSSVVSSGSSAGVPQSTSPVLLPLVPASALAPSGSLSWAVHSVLDHLHLGEVVAMQYSFSHMLISLQKCYRNLADASEKKKHFIRYIFHEVRVPFNAVVLGIDELKELIPSNLAAGPIGQVISMLAEQTDVVKRILNDVLSLQKIEDGGFKLEYTPFAFDRMILSTFQSFRSAAIEKRISMHVELDSLDEFVEAIFPAGRHVQSSASLTVTKQQREHSEEKTRSASHQSTPGSMTRSLLGTPAVHMRRQGTVPSHFDNIRLSTMNAVGDQYRLRQVVANFLSNAIKFTPVGGTVTTRMSITLVTKQQHTSAGGSAAAVAVAAVPVTVAGVGASPDPGPSPDPPTALFRISVSDSGCGMSAVDQKQLWVPYMQIESGIMQEGGGTGLGLTHAKALVELHGGVIGCNSPAPTISSGANLIDELLPSNVATVSLGVGSEFFFELPLQIVKGPPIGSHKPITGSTSHTIEASTFEEPHMEPLVETLAETEEVSVSVCPIRFHFDSEEEEGTTASGELVSTLPVDRSRTRGVVPHVSSISPPAPSTSPPLSSVPLQSRASGSPAVTPSLPGRVLRCLVVDDSIATRKMMIMILRSLRCAADGVEDGLQCVNVMAGNSSGSSSSSSSSSASISVQSANVAASTTMSPPMGSPSVGWDRVDAAPCPYDLVFMDAMMPVRCTSISFVLKHGVQLHCAHCVQCFLCSRRLVVCSLRQVMSGMEATRILRAKGIRAAVVGATGNALEEV
jgi:signal transduction histidine kinase